MIDHDALVTTVRRRADADSGTARAAISAATGAVARQMLNTTVLAALEEAGPSSARCVRLDGGTYPGGDWHE